MNNLIAPTTGICVDASHLMKHKITEYRAVITLTGEELFRAQIKYSSVNCGEYIALIKGLQWIIENDPEDRILWSDSQTALTWFRNRESASSIYLPEMKAGDIFLQVFESEFKDIEVKHWNKRRYGGTEIPADFQRK